MTHFVPASRRHRVTIIGRYTPAHVAIVFRDTEYARAVEAYEQKRAELEQRYAAATSDTGPDLKSNLGKIVQQFSQRVPMSARDILISMQREEFIAQAMALTGCKAERATHLYEECTSECAPRNPLFAIILRAKLDRLALGTLRL